MVGLAPLVARRRGPFRTLAALGRDPSNYWDIVALPDRWSEAAAAVAREIESLADQWDAVALGGVPEDSPVPDALANRGLRVHRRDPDPYPGIELPRNFDEYLARLTSKRRKDLRRHLRRLDEGSLELREVRDPDDLERAIGTWQELRVRWWQARSRRIDPEHAGPRFRAFLTDLAKLLVPAGRCLVWEFRHSDQVVGIEVSLVDDRRFYAWLDGYDPAAAVLGLGKVAIAEGIRSSIAAGRRYFDFMVGAEDYKYSYGAEDRHCEWIMCTSGRPRSLAALAASRALELAGRR